MIHDYVVKYGAILLINKMKFDELIFEQVRTTLYVQKTRSLKIMVATFKVHGMLCFLLGWNILLQMMLLFVYPAFFLIKHLGIKGAKAFTIDGFRTWGKMRGKKCAFLNHVGTNPDSTHKRAKKSCEDLMNQSQHIQHVFHKYTTQDIVDNRLRVKFLIRTARYLALQDSAFRGHDESESSDNRGNFLELLEMLLKIMKHLLTLYQKLLETKYSKRNFTHLFNESQKDNYKKNLGMQNFA